MIGKISGTVQGVSNVIKGKNWKGEDTFFKYVTLLQGGAGVTPELLDVGFPGDHPSPKYGEAIIGLPVRVGVNKKRADRLSIFFQVPKK